jgi:Kef-type K+ transport system membrane component KefB
MSTALITRRSVVYAVALTAAVLIVAGLVQVGGTWFSPAGGPPAPVATSAPGQGAAARMLDAVGQPLPRLLGQLLVILLAARGLGALARRGGQPTVIGEIAAGLLLGPSLLGWLAPAAGAALFPDASLPFLQLLSQIGVLLFMFVVGVELEPSRLRGHAGVAIAVSNAGIVIPFILGVALAFGLYGPYAPAGVPFHSFALFCGIATSITAFPVLARILEDHRLTHTPLGVTALACAAVDDMTAWSILAFVVAVTTSGGAITTLLVTVGLSTAFVLVMLYAVRPALRRVLDPATMGETLSKERIAVVLAVTLTAALVTEVIGIHALFGAFVAGTVMPLGGTFRAVLRERFDSLTSVLLLPIFFAYTGLRTHLGLLDDLAGWTACLAIVVVASVGKLGGTAVAARWSGLPWREATALGALMNTRGLMELIALNVGYDLGILTVEIFTMMVLMALVTTAMTGPLLAITLAGGRRRQLDTSGRIPGAL